MRIIFLDSCTFYCAITLPILAVQLLQREALDGDTP